MFKDSFSRIQADGFVIRLIREWDYKSLWKRWNPIQGLRSYEHTRWILPLLSLLLWAISLGQFNLDQMTDLGLISIFPGLHYSAYAILILSFGLLFLQPAVQDRFYLLHTLVLILMIHATPHLLYGTLRYSWAWKHVGVVEYIQRHGQVDPQIEPMGIYHNWPVFFALNAFLADLIGFPSAHVYAGLAPVFFELLYLLTLVGLLRLFTSNPRLPWLAAWFFILANWVGQDYFSPQALNFYLYLMLLWMVLFWFGSEHEVIFGQRTRYALFSRYKPFFRRLNWLDVPYRPSGSSFSWPAKLAAGLFVLLICGLMVSSHQLSPVIAISALVLLVFFRYCTWRMLPLLMMVMMALWLTFPAATYNRAIFEQIAGSFGKISSNIDSSLINVAQVSPGQAIVSWMGRALTAAMALLAGLGVLRRANKGYLDFPAIVLVVAPIAVLAVSPYGGEVIFRVYLFSLPALAFLAAAFILPDEEDARGVWISLAVWGLSAVLIVGLFFSYYGKEKQYYFSQDEVDAATFLYSNAEPNSLLVEGARNYPAMFINYEYFTYVPLDREPPESQKKLLYDPEGVLADWLADDRYQASYLILTRSQKAFLDAIGIMPKGSLDLIENDLAESDLFEIIYSNQDAIIFQLREGGDIVEE